MGVVSDGIPICYFPLPLIPFRLGRGKFTFYYSVIIDEPVKSPDAALRFTLRHCGVHLLYASFLRVRTPCLRPFYEAVLNSRLLRLL